MFQFVVYKAQLSGAYLVPGTYTSVLAVINDLNTFGISGPVTINVSAGYSEISPVGGYSLTVSGSSVNPIVFQKNGSGANPLLIAYSGGSGTPSSAIQDGVWRLIGSDYVTIDGIDINDPNTTNPSTMEFGFGLFKSSTSDGCQNNTIKNCVITLNRINNASSSGWVAPGSRGIDVVNSLTGSHTTSLVPASAAGANSANIFSNNTIQNCNVGIAVSGYRNPFSNLNTDRYNEIKSNVIINYGGGGSVSPASAIETSYQFNAFIINNLINNNTGTGVNHTGVLRGINTNTVAHGDVTISNNTLTLKSAASTSSVCGINNFLQNSPGDSSLVNVNGNIIENCICPNATNAVFYGILNTSVGRYLSVRNNIFKNNSTNAGSGNYYGIAIGSGYPDSSLADNNVFSKIAFTSTVGSASGLFFTALQAGVDGKYISVSNNYLDSVTVNNSSLISTFITTGAGTGTLTTNQFIKNNCMKNFTLATTGNVTFIYNNNGGAVRSLVSGNICTNISKSILGNTLMGYFGSNNASSTITANSFSNINAAGNTSVTILYSSSRDGSITSNTITNISTGTGTLNGIIGGGQNCEISKNSISNLTGGGFICGLNAGFTSPNPSDTFSVHSNTILSLATTGNKITGYTVLSADYKYRIYKNKIADIQASGTSAVVTGIDLPVYTSTYVTVYLYNNIIGDLRAPASNIPTGSSVIGINIPATYTAPVFNLYNNTIYLNATSSGAQFGTAGILLAHNTNSLVASTCLNNNIIINNSISNGNCKSACFRVTNVPISSYLLSSNNNNFYCNTTSTNSLIFFNNNMYPTLSSFQALVSPAESNSISENSPFLSLTAASPNFLHIDPFSPSLTESGATSFSIVREDVDSDVRFGNPGYIGSGTAPDMGADEYEQNLTMAVKEIEKNFMISIYPNPNKGDFILSIKRELVHGKLIVLDSKGSIAFSHEIFKGDNIIRTYGLTGGAYLYYIIENGKQLSSGKFIIN